jgi:hypothetical protein
VLRAMWNTLPNPALERGTLGWVFPLSVVAAEAD